MWWLLVRRIVVLAIGCWFRLTANMRLPWRSYPSLPATLTATGIPLGTT